MPGSENPILVVDDDNVSRRLLVRMLEAADYTCRQEESGEAALASLRADPPALLLLDYDMPGLNGADVLRQLRSDGSDLAQIPTIMLTGHGGEESEVHCLEAGANDFVTKPIHPAVLRARIETQLRLRSMRDQLVQQNEELENWHEILERDLTAARATQQALIPHSPPVLAGWDVAAFYRPVIQVGGDIYGWLRMRDGRTLFWIADATGHGASAALITTLAKLLFHHANAEYEKPVEIMQAVDRDFRSILGARSFMTAMCVALDPKTGVGSVVGAGHPPLLVAHRDGAIETIASHSPPLGLALSAGFRETTFTLAPGDVFLLYTDGLYGSANGRRRRQTPEHLAAHLDHASASADALLRKIITAAVPENDEAQPDDDIAALAVRRRHGQN
ncbi:MAG: SpoIIE family protein phosphatase [Verrucomicrobiota bacterium]|nr:SpoIIE family protein phosphatase [Verrucomicrobiota bacterium]